METLRLLPLSLAKGIYLEHLALQAYRAGCQNFSVPPFHSCPFKTSTVGQNLAQVFFFSVTSDGPGRGL